MRRRLGLLVSLILTVVFAWSRVYPVQAHAMLMRSIPNSNASLAQSPNQVELFFSEAIGAKLSTISVLDPMGRRMDQGDSLVDPKDDTHLTASLPSLSDGVYVVVWKVISATDGHQTNGTFPFAVGKVDPVALAGAQNAGTTSTIPFGDMFMKGLLYLAAAALMGRILFAYLVWNPSIQEAQVSPEVLSPDTRFTEKFIPGVLVLLGGADLLGLMMQVGQVSGTLIGWPWQPAFLSVLLNTRVGMLSIVRLALTLGLGVCLIPRANLWNRWVGIGLSFVLLLTFSLESHAAADPMPVLPVIADWIHMLGVSVWVGGLFSFLGGIWLIRRLPAETRTLLTSILIPHFSTIAMASVVALGITGIYAAFLRVGTLPELTTTPYGQALILKLIIAFPMVAMGGVNFLITTPNMRRAAAMPGGSPRQVARFGKLLTGEVTLGVLILIWVGVFTSLPPARVPLPPPVYQATVQADDLTITLNIDPARPGINSFLAAIKSGQQPLTQVKSVGLEFTSISGMVPQAKADMSGQGDGTYHLTGGFLGMPDQWDIKVVVVRSGKFDTYGDFKINLGQKTGQMMP